MAFDAAARRSQTACQRNDYLPSGKEPIKNRANCSHFQAKNGEIGGVVGKYNQKNAPKRPKVYLKT